MIKEYIGINPIHVEGSKYENGYGISKFINLKIGGKSYVPVISAVINTWGIKNEDKIKEKVFGKIIEEKDNLHFSINCTNVEILGNFIAGYPSIRIGESPWGPTNGFSLGQCKDYRKINISTEWKFNVSGNANFAYDIWLCKNKKGVLDKNDIEIMVWLDYNFNLPREIIGENEDFVLKYKIKDAKTNQGKHCFSFILKNRNGKNIFDLIELLELCKKKVPNIKDYFIRSIELGIEFSKNTKAEVRLEKLDFDFKKRRI